MIGEHVHGRDGEQKDKETLAHLLKVAYASGKDAIIDVVNKDDPVVGRKSAIERMELAKAANSPLYYGVYILATPEFEQLREAVEVCREFSFAEQSKKGELVWVAGIKAFMGKSVGNTSIIGDEPQLQFYRNLVRLGFKEVVAEHCEQESEMHPELWNPKNPITHSLARPEISEIASVKKQIEFAKKTGYATLFNGGRLHLFHLSVPYSVLLVHYAKNDLNITCEATFHHLLLDNLVMNNEDGIAWKVNPPLRAPATRKELFSLFLRKYFNTIGTDHAPHTPAQKFSAPFMSGLPAEASVPEYIEHLEARGVPRDLIGRMMHENIEEIYGIRIPKSGRQPKPGIHVGEYAFNPLKYLRKNTA